MAAVIWTKEQIEEVKRQEGWREMVRAIEAKAAAAERGRWRDLKESVIRMRARAHSDRYNALSDVLDIMDGFERQDLRRKPEKK